MDDFIPDDKFTPDQQASAPAPQQGASADFIPDDQFQPDSSKYNTPGQTFGAAIEGAAKGVVGPVAPAVERYLMGIKPEDIRGREEAHPKLGGISEAGGFLGSMLTGVGEAALVAKAGEAAVHAIPATTAMAKIGSAAVRGATEMALINSGEQAARAIVQDPNESVAFSVPEMGLNTLIGAVGGGIFGSVSPLWKVAKETEFGGRLAGLVDRVSGRAGGGVSADMETALRHSGIEVGPEVRAMLSEDPLLQETFKTLQQQDTTGAGKAVQAAYQNFKDAAHESLANALGKPLEEVGSEELSKYESGKKLGQTLAEEYSQKLDPLTREFDELKLKYADAPLAQDSIMRGSQNHGNPYDPSYPEGKAPSSDVRLPGTTSQLGEKISQLAESEGWTSNNKSEIMSQIRSTLKRLPNMKKLSDLTKLQTQIGNETKSTLPFGMQTPLSRAGMLMKNIIRDAEGELAIARLGEQAPELAERMKSARSGYGALSNLREELDSRLGVRGSTSGFAKGLKEMAQTDGEALVRKLSGTNDAALLPFLSENFPKTAEALKKYHVDSLADMAVKRARAGESINASALVKAVEKMSPELRNFTLSPEAQQKIFATNKLLDQYAKLPHNYSNTSRMIDRAFEFVPSSVVSAVALLSGHGYAAMLSPVAGFIGKEGLASARYAMLKMLGSSEPVSAGGFKAMAEFIGSSVRGERKITSSVSKIFKSGEILPSIMAPNKKDRDRLDESLQEIQKNPNTLLQKPNQVGHYMPEHSSAMAAVVGNAATYLNGLRPQKIQNSPLDKPYESPIQKQAFERALDIAQQPLIVLKNIKNGTIVPHEVEHLKALYPSLYATLSDRIHNEIIDKTSRGETIPYQMRLGLSLFLGQSLDSTTTQESIAAAQMAQNRSVASAQAPQQGAAQRGKSLKSLNKMGEHYATAGQSREAQMQRTKV